VLPFKELTVDVAANELVKLETAYEGADKQLSLQGLRLKKQQLNEQDLNLLKNFIPQNLHAGYLVYNLGQMANQNRLTLKGLQYSIISEQPNANLKLSTDKKLMIEFTVEGRYADYINWLTRIETTNVLIDVESVRATKNSNQSDIISFHTKMYAYGININ
jgi:hypothetical protein